MIPRAKAPALMFSAAAVARHFAILHISPISMQRLPPIEPAAFTPFAATAAAIFAD